jgi:predicted lipoprotein with Yx(FWY)xxD motif
MKDDNTLTTGGHTMKRLLIVVVAAVVAVLALAACGGGGSDSGSASAPSGNGTATVAFEDIGDSGRVLVDSAGKALYESDQEANGSVMCTDACTAFWMPLTIDSGAPTGTDVPGKLGVAERPDGTRQVTLDGRRLYSFAKDQPGEVTGDGLSDAFAGQQFTWHVVTADGSTSNQGGSTSDNPYGY